MVWWRVNGTSERKTTFLDDGEEGKKISEIIEFLRNFGHAIRNVLPRASWNSSAM